MLAVKLNEQVNLSLQQAVDECKGVYTKQAIEKCEKMILSLLEWRVNIPTPFEFASYFLYLANNEFDFESILIDSAFVSLELLKSK